MPPKKPAPQVPEPRDYAADDLVGIHVVKAELGVRSKTTIYALMERGILERPLDWGLRYNRWTWAQVQQAKDRMRRRITDEDE